MRKIVLVFALILLSIAGVSALSSYTNYQSRASYQSYYSSNQIANYWPILAEKDQCQAREDFLLQVSPGGCQPAVVRSDLLADQNVPVFCQIDALQVNPIVNVKEINSISFQSTNKPKEIVDVGFHPARAALRTRDTLLGSPLINNVGYVVVVLKRNENEKSLPNFVNVTLNARVSYDSGNAVGIGRSEFLMAPMSEDEWNVEKNKQSFFQGRYFLRVDEANDNFASVSLYYQDRKIGSSRVEKGKLSDRIYLPGFYCKAALQVSYDGFVQAEDKAVIEIGTGETLDRLNVYEGSKILNGRCTVSKIKIGAEGSAANTGNISLSCGGKTISLANTLREHDYVIGSDVYYTPDLKKPNNQFEAKITGINLPNTKNGVITYKVNYDSREVDNVLKSNLKARITYTNDLQNGKVENSVLEEKLYTKEIEDSFNEAIKTYENIADDYPSEKEGQADTSYIGENALIEAIDLSRNFGKVKTEFRLMNRYIEVYSQGKLVSSYTQRMSKIGEVDERFANDVFEISGKQYTIRLIDFEEQPKESTNVDLIVGSSKVNLKKGDSQKITNGKITLVNARKDSIVLRSECDSEYSATRNSGSIDNREGSLNLKTLQDKSVSGIFCGNVVVLDNINLAKLAKVSVIPEVKGTETRTNFTVNIGIEKRAIKLSPAKTEEMIKNLNSTIKKWESISKQLGNVVSGLKAACFATSTALTVKNFFSGLSGEAIARQEVMKSQDGWNTRCQQLVAKGEVESVSKCFSKYSAEINADVETYKNTINKVNERIKAAESGKCLSESKELFGGSNVDSSCAVEKYIVNVRESCQGIVFKDGNQQKELDNLLKGDDAYSKEGRYSYTQLRDLETACLLSKQKGTTIANVSKSKIEEIGKTISDRQQLFKNLQDEQAARASGEPVSFVSLAGNQQQRVADIVGVSGMKDGPVKSKLTTDKVQYVSSTVVTAFNDPKTGANFQSGKYFIALEKQGEFYNPVGVYDKDGNSVELGKFLNTYKIGTLSPANEESYRNKIVDPKVSYYEVEPYKGLPAIVPFDVQTGWYAATKPQLPVLGAQGSFDASGRVVSYWVCNVGKNGRMQFLEGIGDDSCLQFNANSGQSIGSFPGLSVERATSIIQNAQKALQSASEQYGDGKGPVKIGGTTLARDKPAAALSGSQCQDFMNPDDCKLLFNVCDPVICPSSRCDLGGAYPVADVVQTGIVGSALLCLPNAGEVLIPICLTGIQAGIDSYLSILKAHRDCLSESLKSGKMIGICDQLYSVYLCEFFWRQVAPVANILIPKLVEIAYSGGLKARGGAEYLTVMGAWQNMQKSVNYFTQVYAVNSLKAFQLRNFEEVGSEFCRSFISAKGPKSFKSLIEPESPPQFYASFSSIKYSSATVPATAQYKVFYHIFAGKDAGVYYSVYLKSPPEQGFYSYSQTIQVSSGFIQNGEYKDETRDFTAPEGYKELCVRINDKEECGFKQVTTDFAVNALRDKFVSDEAKNTNIASDKTCVAGSPSLGSALVNTNLQAGVEEAINPTNYNRGIVRICATNNPGSSTNPTRYVEVGTCDDKKIKCWLDKNSVGNAITDNNIGMKNETLKALEGTQHARLQANGELYTNTDANAEISSIKDAVKAVQSSQNKDDALVIVKKIDSDLLKVVSNSHKAQLLFYKAKALRVVADVSKGPNKGVNTGTTAPISTPVTPIVPVVKPSYVMQTFDPAGLFPGALTIMYRVELDGKDTNIYLDQGKKQFYINNGGPYLVASVFDNVINVDSTKVSALVKDRAISSETANHIECLKMENYNDLIAGTLVSC